MARFTSTKSQILSIETMVMVVFFALFAATFYTTFNSRSSSVGNVIEMRELEKRIIQSSEMLIRTQGFPHDWNQTNVIQPGFLDGETCSFEKLEMFFNMSQSKINQALNLESYSIFLNITSVYNYTERISMSSGVFPDNAEIASPIYLGLGS